MTTPLVQRLRAEAERATAFAHYAQQEVDRNERTQGEADEWTALAKTLTEAAEALAGRAEPVAWMTDDGRVIPEYSKEAGRRSGGATKSATDPYHIALYTTPPRAGGGEVGESERLDFVLANDAFLWKKVADSGATTYQLWTQDEDELFIVLSGESNFYAQPRQAIDAAIHGAGVRGGENG